MSLRFGFLFSFFCPWVVTVFLLVPMNFFIGIFFSAFPTPLVMGFNSGNPKKTNDYSRIFQSFGLPIPHFQVQDLKEIQGTHLDVVVHKASQFAGQSILVDDVSLNVDGAEVGVNVKWLIRDLQKYLHKRATFVTYLGIYLQGQVYVFQGKLEGVIVSPRGNARKGGEFDPYFQPLYCSKTLAEDFPDEISPRYQAAKNLAHWIVFAQEKPIFYWNGPWQKD